MIRPLAEIRATLSELVGQPLRSMWRAGFQAFEFGEAHSCTNRRGEQIKIHDFLLHVSCGWRIERDGVVLVPAEEPRKDEALINEVADGILTVQMVEAHADGSFRLVLTSNTTLCVDNLPSEGEGWRLHYFDQTRPHFVVENRCP